MDSVRSIKAKVYFTYAFSDSAPPYILTSEDHIKSIKVERTSESGKFFGFGVAHKATLKLIDKDSQLDYLTTDKCFHVQFDDGGGYSNAFPPFFITEVHRDENTGELSVTGYDILKKAAEKTVGQLLQLGDDIPYQLTAPYTMWDVVQSTCGLLNMQVAPPPNEAFDLVMGSGANFDGSETLREAFTAIAEATQTIYFVSHNEYELSTLEFKELNVDAEPYEITKSKYFTLKSGDNRRLAQIVHATELGDNVSVSTGQTGSTQYVRNNPFWDLNDEIGNLLNDAIARVGGFTINQFECKWRGDFLLGVGERLALTTKDNETVYSYLLDDVLEYDGALSQTTQWAFEENESETESNPTNLGEALKQTFARVDKANKQIELLTTETSAQEQRLSQLVLDVEGITGTVTETKKATEEAIDGLNENVSTLTNKVEASITAKDVEFLISTEMEKGIEKVTTSTGFTFDEKGLKVSKSDSDIETQITEDGMTVSKDGETVLTANNEGVNARNLHATTYLIIGETSRFEDYDKDGEMRTGCFWIGG